MPADEPAMCRILHIDAGPLIVGLISRIGVDATQIRCSPIMRCLSTQRSCIPPPGVVGGCHEHGPCFRTPPARHVRRIPDHLDTVVQRGPHPEMNALSGYNLSPDGEASRPYWWIHSTRSTR